ncbi:hypothetical protein [Ascidiaceihabitans sp.]|uniref:hypothetical protein n=1 Tax=Ascidiaceihabitans sp. TaxID=1872644 RepID=UPI003297F3FC
MSHHLKEEFWDCIEDAREGMLSSGFGRTVPMSHYADDDEDGKDDPNLQLVPLTWPKPRSGRQKASWHSCTKLPKRT